MVQQFLSTDFWLGQPPFSVLHLYLDSCAPSEHTSAFNMQGQAKKKSYANAKYSFCVHFFIYLFIFFLIDSVVQISNLPSGLCWLVGISRKCHKFMAACFDMGTNND